MKRKKIMRGQSTAEYAVLIGLVVAAVLAMQTYVKRGLQAKLADGADVLSKANEGSALTVNKDYAQFEPYYAKQTNREKKTNQKSNRKYDYKLTGATDEEETSVVNVEQTEIKTDKYTET